MPVWSPDGTQIVFVSPSPTTNQPILFVVDAEGQRDPQVVSGPNYQAVYRPAWSPDGDLIVFDLGREPVLGGRRLSTGQDEPVSTPLVMVENPDFSTDGSWIVFDGVGEGQGLEIYLMLSTGSGLTALTDDPAADYQPTWRP